RTDTAIYLAYGLRNAAAEQLAERRNGRVEVGRVQYKLLLVDAVAAQRIERQGFGYAVIKQAGAGSDYRLCRLALGCEAPGDAHPGCYIAMAADSRRRFVPQAQAHREIGPDAPIVQREEAKVELAEAGERISGRDGELARAAAGSMDLLRRPAGPLAHQRGAV